MTFAVVILVIFLMLYVGRTALRDLFVGGSLFIILFPIWGFYVVLWPSYSMYTEHCEERYEHEKEYQLSMAKFLNEEYVEPSKRCSLPRSFQHRMNIVIPPLAIVSYLSDGEGILYAIYVSNFVIFLSLIFWIVVVKMMRDNF